MWVLADELKSGNRDVLFVMDQIAMIDPCAIVQTGFVHA
jgi:hypothetical protein